MCQLWFGGGTERLDFSQPAGRATSFWAAQEPSKDWRYSSLSQEKRPQGGWVG